MSKTVKLTNVFTQVTEQDLPDQNLSPSSKMNITTTLCTSRSNYLHGDVEVTEMSQAGSTSTCLTTELPINSLNIPTPNVDSSCFTIQSDYNR